MPGAWPGCWATSGMPCTAVQAGGLGDRREQGIVCAWRTSCSSSCASAPSRSVSSYSAGMSAEASSNWCSRGNNQRLAVVCRRGAASRLDVEAARTHTLHHAVGFASGNPHAAVRRNGPCAIVRFHFHHPAHAVEHLGAPVRMGVEQGARRVVGADGQHGAPRHPESSGTLRMAMDGLNRRIIDQSARAANPARPIVKFRPLTMRFPPCTFCFCSLVSSPG